MINSMTAFARTTNDKWICEIRSINHRFLEISCYLPEPLRQFEMEIRDSIKQKINRGKVDVAIRPMPGAELNNITINYELTKTLCELAENLKTQLPEGVTFNAFDLLKFSGVIQQKPEKEESLKQNLFLLLNETMNSLVKNRQREGEQIKQFLMARVDALMAHLQKVKAQLPSLVQEEMKRLKNRLVDLKVEVDATRLEQEMVIFAQKIDVSEEVDRAHTHINEIAHVLEKGGVLGRRMDFLLQELNREVNTLSSKSLDKTLTHHALEMKVLNEQFREQIQNIE